MRGVSIEIDGVVIKYTAYLRKWSGYTYINMAEFDAALKCINLALKCRVKDIEIRTYLATLLNWINYG